MRANSRPMSVGGAREEVAHAPHRLDEARLLGIELELGADLGNVNVDGAVEGVGVSLERVEDLLPGKDTPGRPGQGGEELELVVGQHPALARHRDLARGEVELDLADAEAGGRLGGRGATEEGANPREELPGVEGLGQVVV